MDDGSIYVRGLVAYDGTDFRGFQAQERVPTIQGALEAALGNVAQLEGRIAGAGRTDAGVHASGQVVAGRVVWKHGLEALQRAWNVHLPRSIRVWRLHSAQDDFHPRFSAVSRTYQYTVYHNQAGVEQLPLLSPLTDRYALYENRPLDWRSMNSASKCLLGSHDFASFGQPPQGTNTVRTVVEAAWQADEVGRFGDSYPGARLVFTISANAFLRHMVRNIVGSLLEVGRGRWRPQDLTAVLRACDRSQSASPAAPNGLVLHEVKYR